MRHYVVTHVQLITDYVYSVHIHNVNMLIVDKDKGGPGVYINLSPRLENIYFRINLAFHKATNGGDPIN